MPDRTLSWSPRFLVCGLLLLTMAVAFRPVVAALDRHYAKAPIALRRPLTDFDFSRLPSFVVAPDVPAYDTTPEAVGTEHWMSMGFRERLGSSTADPAVLFVTYYSDPSDQVPHVPEVCYRQGGILVEGYEERRIDTPSLGPDQPRTMVRVVNVSRREAEMVVVYVFHCNGNLLYDRQQVRLSNGMPGDRYTYFSKVEVLTAVPPGTDRQDAIDRAARLLDEALHVLIDDHYPAKEDLRGKR